MSDCMECKIGEVDKDGYRRLKSLRRRVHAHRFVYEIFNGPIPSGMIVMHTCDNPPCVNPEHLKLGTVLENVEDRCAKERTSSGSKHYCAKVDEETVKRIKILLNNGARPAEVARSLGVGRYIVHDINRGRTWKNVHV